MFLTNLHFTNFRNYKTLSLAFPSQGAVFEGLNGSGKTNILEGIYLLCTGRSQRGANRAAMIHFDEKSAYVEGVFCGQGKQQDSASIGFDRERNVVMKRDETGIAQFSEWFGQWAAVSFSADDLDIVYGAPESRRKFLDLLISQIDRDYLEALICYRRNMLQRNNLLGNSFDRMQIQIYEEKMADYGAQIVKKRQEMVLLLSGFLTEFYSEISGKKETANAVFFPSIPGENSSINDWKNVFYNVLNERREKDIILGYSSVGPHRDEIRFLLDKKPARTYGSQGQCRSLALSLKLGSVRCLEQFRKDNMLFLIDDAVSELDPERTSRVYPLIKGKGQVFIATPSLNVPLEEGLLRCVVRNGEVFSG